MFARRLFSGVLLAFTLVAVTWAAAPPPNLDRYVADLGDDDPVVWKKAQNSLWATGERAIPALRAAAKNSDADVVLRSAIVLSKIEWGITPETPAAVVTQIERYRGGDAGQKNAAVAELGKLSGPGFAALRRVLTKETNAESRRVIADLLKMLVRPQAQHLIAAGELDAAERLLESTAPNSIEATLDYCTFLVLTGRADAKARTWEAKADDKDAARIAAFLRRGMGDLPAALRAAERTDVPWIVNSVLEEMEDFQTLAKSPPDEFVKAPYSMAALYARAGDRAGVAVELAKLKEEDRVLYFYVGMPRQGVSAYRKQLDLVGAAQLLLTHGRRRDVLALSAPEKDAVEQAAPLLIEQGATRFEMGDEEGGKKLFADAMKRAETGLAKGMKENTFNDYALARRMRAGKRLDRLADAIDDVGGVLDRLKPTASPYSTLSELTTASEGEEIEFLWRFLRQHQKDAAPSVTLKTMHLWFNEKKADKAFDDALAAAAKWDGAKDRRADWAGIRAKACIAVGKLKQAEELYAESARDSKTAAGYKRLGDYYFEQKQWQEAETAYAAALRLDASQAVPTYLHGVALTKLDRTKEGRALAERARLMILGDEATRYTLAEDLAKKGLADEAEQEFQLLMRLTPFRSIYASNAGSSLSDYLVRKKRYAQGATALRRMYTNMAFSRAGVFTETRAYLIVPGRVHQYQTQAYVAAGKLDDAMAEARLLAEHLPEETAVIAELVRALDKAGRTDDAERTFAVTAARLRRACADAPKASDPHNHLAWLLARCGRKLDLALTHAKRAADVSPKSAVVLDTLAEVYFQRGDKDEALKAIAQAIKLAPDWAFLVAQRKRIEAGDPKAELPPQS